MLKVGRNDPCPCGSGKKFKKCCVGKEEQRLEDSIKDYLNSFLEYEEVNEMSTDAIINKLKGMGIPFERETFFKDIDRFYSAQDLSENWFKQYPVSAKGRDEDFPWLAAWILWERLGPDNKLSREQISNLVDNGYKYLEDRDAISACNEWLKAWEAIKGRVDPSFKKLDYLDKHYSSSFFISNVCQDLEAELYHAGLKDPVYFEKRIDYCREFCTFFPNESELILHNMRRDIAESYALLNRYNEAESEFEKLVQDYPDNPWGYIGWGDIFFLIGQKQDYNKAREQYEKALAVAKDKEDIVTVKERLEDLKKEEMLGQ